MIVFITTGYGKNVIGGADLWCNNFIENVLPLINEDYKIVVDGRPLIKEFGAIYTYENEKEVDRIDIIKFNTDDNEINDFTQKFYRDNKSLEASQGVIPFQHKILIKLFNECLKQERYDQLNQTFLLKHKFQGV